MRWTALRDTAVKFEHISMAFPGVLANDDVSLEIQRGEVFALVGENGAGKSTLMNILYGINTPTDGRVFIQGREVAWGLAWSTSTSCWCPPSQWPRTSS